MHATVWGVEWVGPVRCVQFWTRTMVECTMWDMYSSGCVHWMGDEGGYIVGSMWNSASGHQGMLGSIPELL